MAWGDLQNPARLPTRIHPGAECKLHASKNTSQLGSNRIISQFFRLSFVWNHIAVIIFEYDLFGFGVSHFETHLILFNENPYVMLLYTSWFIRPLSNSLLQALYNWVKNNIKKAVDHCTFQSFRHWSSTSSDAFSEMNPPLSQKNNLPEFQLIISYLQLLQGSTNISSLRLPRCSTVRLRSKGQPLTLVAEAEVSCLAKDTTNVVYGIHYMDLYGDIWCRV